VSAMDDALEIEGYDGIDDGPSYIPSPGRKSIPNPGRRSGKKTLSSSSVSRGGRRSRPMGRSFGLNLNINPRQLAESVSSMLVMAVIGVIAVVAILYYTFSSGLYPSSLPQFYGALAASMVFVLLLSCVAVKLLGIGD
jgi:hypothetical protein